MPRRTVAIVVVLATLAAVATFGLNVTIYDFDVNYVSVRRNADANQIVNTRALRDTGSSASASSARRRVASSAHDNSQGVISAEPLVLNNNDIVTVEVRTAAEVRPSEDDWVGMYSPAPSDYTTAAAPIKYSFCSESLLKLCDP
jgi:hypothetical protein